jgi:plasmid segregation protein ParM
MIIGLDIGFGYTKSATESRTDVFPSVVGEWTPGAFRLGAALGDGHDAEAVEAVRLDGRSYVVGDRALRLAHRRFVGLSREWMESAAFRALALTALYRLFAPSDAHVTVITGLPVEDVEPHGTTVRRQLEGTHQLWIEPRTAPWTVTVTGVQVLPQPLGTVLAQLLDASGQLVEGGGLEDRVGVLDVGFRTTDYFTLQGLEVVPAECLTRNTGIADLLLDLSREIYRRWGVELDPHALDEPALQGALRIAGESVKLGSILDPLLDRHAEAIAAHARMLWGDQARGLARLWLTGGGAALLGGRLKSVASHAEHARHARMQNAVGYYRYGERLQREAAPDRVVAR